MHRFNIHLNNLKIIHNSAYGHDWDRSARKDQNRQGKAVIMPIVFFKTAFNFVTLNVTFAIKSDSRLLSRETLLPY